mgnify:FL=1
MTVSFRKSRQSQQRTDFTPTVTLLAVEDTPTTRRLLHGAVFFSLSVRGVLLGATAEAAVMATQVRHARRQNRRAVFAWQASVLRPVSVVVAAAQE